MPPKPKIEGAPESVDDILNKKGFVEFLAQSSSTESVDDGSEEVVREQYEIFVARNEAKKEFAKLCSEQVGSHFGLKLGSEQLKLVEVHIEKMALENPEELVRMREGLHEYFQLPKDIQEFETRLGQLGNTEDLQKTLEELKSKHAALVRAGDRTGMVGWARGTWQKVNYYTRSLANWANKDDLDNLGPDETDESLEQESADIQANKEAVRSVRKEYGKIKPKEIRSEAKNIEDIIRQTEQRIKILETVDEQKKLAESEYTKMRMELVGRIGEVAGLSESIQAMATSELDTLCEKGSFADLEKAQQRFVQMAEARNKESMGIDPFEGSDEGEFQDYLNSMLQKGIADMIVDAVSKMRLGDNPLSRLERTLIEVTKRSKGLGSLDTEDTKAFMVAEIEKATEGLGSSVEDKAKKLLISRVVHNLKNS